MVELSALVPCRDGAGAVARFLPLLVESLGTLGIDTEVVVVDDASSDGTAAAAEACPGVRVVRHERHLGASAARNSAASAAGGRWLLFCDDDVEVPPAALAALWEARHPGRCLVPVVNGLDGRVQNAVTARWHLGDLKFVHWPHPVPTVAYPMGACFLVSRHLYWQVGGFDPRYFPNSYEDAAFGAALTRAGAGTTMVAAASVVHHMRIGRTPEEAARREAAHRACTLQKVYRNRWLFDLLALRGWRRWTAVGLGVPRTAAESLRNRSLDPVRGYLLGWSSFLAGRR